MIRNKDEAVFTASNVPDDDNYYVRIPKSIAEKAALDEGFSVTFVAGTKAIKRFVEDGEVEGAYFDFGTDGNDAILLTF